MTASAFAGSFVVSLVGAACVVVTYFAYLAVAIQIVLVTVDCYITVLGGGVLFLSFAASRWTAAYAEHLVTHVFYLGTYAFLLYSSLPPGWGSRPRSSRI